MQAGSARNFYVFKFYSIRSGGVMSKHQGRQPQISSNGSNPEGCNVAIIGRACRLPGANSTAQLWDLLSAGRCAVSRIPEDRWSLDRLGHQRPRERGRSYSWSAGVLDDIWGFDPAVFGISPREAEQMDPQQRLLLELTFEALQDAGIRPSDFAGKEAGVFVGGSSLDYGNLRIHDSAGADAYFATGNSLAILSNRISYVFDLHGPSYTVDTACSSSLVALDAALAAIQSGRIDTAIVGGANALVSPFGFISFSQATMLSPTGLCQAFSAKADGYVRAEGGVVLILRSMKSALANADRIHARVAGSWVNSDGRTSGISLPSKTHQMALLQRAYAASGFSPDQIAFFEAHGTGTRVGDPIEATAIGEVLGQRRAHPLPIGSIKSNIGHTEPASGLAGVIKAMLALEHDELPRSLHCDELNPDIPFDELNLSVCAAPLALPRDGRPRYAGVNSFGFGGTNAHVILADPPAAPAPNRAARPPEFLLLSAQSQDSLAALAGTYSAQFSGVDSAQMKRMIAAAGHRRELHSERLAIPVEDRASLIKALDEASLKTPGCSVAVGAAVERAAPVAFVFSGNGSQWPGMGRSAYAASAAYRVHFDAIDAAFGQLSGWSLKEMMFSPDIETHLEKTSVAQPLIFAIQAATARQLRQLGLIPAMTLGHSMGEIAAAEAAGILDLESAVRVIYYRSRRQELVRNAGSLAVVFGPREAAEALAESVPGVAIAAHNSPRSFTVAGSFEALDRLARASRTQKVRIRRLDLAYPFHSALMDPAEAPLLADLKDLQPGASRIPFISTVEGRALRGPELGARYWWRNVREPVHFLEGVEVALGLGARVFVKIGPAASLVADIKEIAEQNSVAVAALGVHQPKPSSSEPFRAAVAQALTFGAQVDAKAAFGDDPGPISELPAYPWRRAPYRLAETSESPGVLTPRLWHPLIGARLSDEALEWRGQIDPTLVPALGDHRVEGQVLLPGAALAEMALAVARDWLDSNTAAVTDLEILQPMIFPANLSREILCRANALTSGIEILSRPRLSNTPFVLHAKAQVIRKPSPTAAPALIQARGENSVAGEALYEIAARSGLNFGPAFRQVAAATRIGDRSIVVDLAAAKESAVYGLDPARLDSCFHGLILLFAELSADRAAAYLPVRFGEISLEKPGASIARAQINVQRCDETAIIAEFALFDAKGELIAALRSARYQAVRARPRTDLASHCVVETLALADEPTAVRRKGGLSSELLIRTARAELEQAKAASLLADLMLLEGWAAAAAYRLCAAFAVDGKVAPDALIATGRFPAGRRSWLVKLLVALEQSGLAEAQGGAQAGQFLLAEGLALPHQGDILQSLASDHPRRAAELLLAARAGAAMEALARGEADIGPVSEAAIESFEVGSNSAAAAAGLLAELLKRGPWPKDRALRILQVGHGPLSSHALELTRSRRARLTIFEPDSRRLERARLAAAGAAHTAFASNVEDLPAGAFDLVIAAQALHRIAPNKALLARIVERMAPEALIAALEPAPSLFRDLVAGLFGEAGHATEGAALSSADWAARLESAGLRAVAAESIATEGGPALLLGGRTPKAPARRNIPATAVIVCDFDPHTIEIAGALSNLLGAAGVECAIARGSAVDEQSLGQSGAIIFLSGPFSSQGSSIDHLAARCLALKSCGERLGKSKARLWIVCPGALRGDAAGADPLEAGFWAFARCFANEFPNRDIRRIDLAPELSAHAKAERLADIILSGTTETDIVLDGQTTRVLRLHRREPARMAERWPAAAASRLEKGEGSGLDRIRWTPIDRKPPGPGQIEVAVAAAGLNFRDVMWGLSILPDEMLEEGFAGPTLGLECAGHVCAIGEGVTGFRIGDPVVAFAGGSFATHVVARQELAAVAPANMALEAAATIPVAFLTAYYGLITCAGLEAGEWVLIHGGAGGVGLAALQIARWRGARVIATAGSLEKRNLVKALGAEHVFDARSGGFVDEVRQVTGKGVAVVLNSLSGEAMERSIGLLEPFGRFVELGKRDYLANTHIGLRPFRKNLAYFGVDLDQLILVQAEKGQKIFRTVMQLFADGDFSPLPYRAFPAREHIDAMRLMQQAGHIGKIVISPPAEGEIRVEPRGAFVVDPERTHLITGGFGGFGLETARWLIERGARHLVLMGRSGASSPEAQEALAEFKASGAQVHSAALDIADGAAVDKLFAGISQTMPPLAGVMHAAAVLEDAIIANLDAAKLRAVLAPKVLGAENLDRLTRNTPLDYFILFSSATTAIGNPGQASYVAANGFLEGLARRRRAAGEPALAIAWGAIEDVGLLARNRAAKESLATKAGVGGIAARTALDCMGEALARSDELADDAVLIIGEINWTIARGHLPLLQAPSFDELIRENAGSEEKCREKIDIGEIVATKAPEEARKIVADLIAAEIAHILRLPQENLSRIKPLSEIGLDSLMAAELGLSLEERLSLDAPLSASAGGFTVMDLADHVIGLCANASREDEAAAQELAERHLGKGIDAAALAPIAALVEEKSRDLTKILQ